MTPSPRSLHRLGRGLGLLCLTLGLGVSASPAQAWDPSTTHQGLLEAAVTRSAVHLRWMDASELERGLFSSLRLDPERLSETELRMVRVAVARGHSDVGAAPLGGPGSCPRADAPPDTQLFCVDRDLWQLSALGWLRLGMVAEVSPPVRHTHHFLDGDDPTSLTWEDSTLPASLLRSRSARSNGEPRAGAATGTNFDGRSPSALAWLEDPQDLLAPPQTFAHLRSASLAPTKAERDHHFALALMGVGALIHVVQDLSVPAHARGDAAAFFAPLSPAPGDRGLPLQEFARVEYGRSDLPGVPRSLTGAASSDDPSGLALSQSLVGHLLGADGYEGLATLAGRRFLSEATVPSPAYLDDSLSPSQAATALLADDHGLDPTEVDGAILAPWPGQRGYLLSPTGRTLAAFDLDLDGRVRPYLDETCYRDQTATLLPAAVDATRSILDLLWPAWPAMTRSGDSLSLTLPEWSDAELTVFVEDANGDRRELGRHPLAAGESTVPLGAPTLAAGERVVLVLTASRPPGPPVVLEQILAADLPQAPEPEPEPEPEPDGSSPAPEEPADGSEPVIPDAAQADPPDVDSPAG